MPVPLVEPRPVLPPERFGAPDEAQEASYLAASARMRSFVASFGSIIDVHHMFWSPTILAAVTAALPLHPSLGQPALRLGRVPIKLCCPLCADFVEKVAVVPISGEFFAVQAKKYLLAEGAAEIQDRACKGATTRL